MRDLSERLEFPSQHHSHPLQQVARQLDVTNIGGVILGVDIVVLQNSLSIEVVDESLVFEMLVNLAMFLLINLILDEIKPLLAPQAPLRLWRLAHEDRFRIEMKL